MFTFGGFFITKPNIPVWWRWLNTIDPVRYALEMVIMPQFDCTLPLSQCPTVVGAQGKMLVKDYVSEFLGFKYGNYSECVGWFLLILAVMQALVMVVLHNVKYIRR